LLTSFRTAGRVLVATVWFNNRFLSYRQLIRASLDARGQASIEPPLACSLARGGMTNLRVNPFARAWLWQAGLLKPGRSERPRWTMATLIAGLSYICLTCCARPWFAFSRVRAPSGGNEWVRRDRGTGSAGHLRSVQLAPGLHWL